MIRHGQLIFAVCKYCVRRDRAYFHDGRLSENAPQCNALIDNLVLLSLIVIFLRFGGFDVVSGHCRSGRTQRTQATELPRPGLHDGLKTRDII